MHTLISTFFFLVSITTISLAKTMSTGFRAIYQDEFASRTQVFFNQITLLPSFSLLFGNQHLIYEQVNYRLFFIALRKLRAGQITRRQLEQARDLIINQTEENVYGIMNYTISFPVYFYIKRSSFMLNYSYNIPVALPGEINTLENNSFFSISYVYSIPFR